MKLRISLFLIFISVLTAFGQTDFSGNIELNGVLSTKEDLPFWFYSNQRGRVSKTTSISGLLQGKFTYELSDNSSLEFGGGIYYEDAFNDKVFIDELYVNFNYEWLQVIIGRKQESVLYKGLSTTNENILWAINSRPLWGLQVRSVEPIFLGPRERFGFRFGYEDYINDENLPTSKFFHHKSFHVILNSDFINIEFGLQHFAQWGGEVLRYGKQPESLNDYFKIVAGLGGGEDAFEGEQENVLGNHQGSWEIYMTKQFATSKIRFIYNSIFDDASGLRLANFPDGRYGIFWQFTEKAKYFNSVIYEFNYTKHQSHDVNAWGADNYLNNGIYSFGWAYGGKVIGSPFFTYDTKSYQITNNKFITHHVGFSGQFSTHIDAFPYKVLLSYAHNEGIYSRKLNAEGLDEDVFNFYSKFRILNLPVQADVMLGMELNSVEEPKFAAGISLSKSF